MSPNENLLSEETQEDKKNQKFDDFSSDLKTIIPSSSSLGIITHGANQMSLSISSPEKLILCQSISFYRYASNCLQHCINEKLEKCGGGFVSDDPGKVMVNFIRSIFTGNNNKMYDDYNLWISQVVQSAQLHAEKSGLNKGWVTAMVKLQFNKDGVYFEAFRLIDNCALKMFKKEWFHFHPKISKDNVVRDSKEFLNGFFLVVMVGNILLNHQDCVYSSLLSIKRKSNGRDCYSSLPMEIFTRYEFHHDVSSHFYSGTSTLRRSAEVINTSCLGVCSSPDIGGSGYPTSFADDVMIEILSRLPVKSLMRFKSVCKHWLFMIKKDKCLIDLHFSHWKSRPNLLYMDPLQEKGIHRTTYGGCFDASKTLRQSISCAEMVDQGSGCKEEVVAIFSKFRITDDQWFPYNEILGPVNGLVCFVDWKTYGVRVYNPSTRETTPWVKSTLLAEENDKLVKIGDNRIVITTRHCPMYQFGFDPEKKEYKVFCFWRLDARPPHSRSSTRRPPDYAMWEVLTVGRDTEWRKMSMVPNEKNKTMIREVLSPYEGGTEPVYANGTLYWRNKVRSSATPWDDPEVIVALDVGSEKFRVIPIPKFILDEPRGKSYRRPFDMLISGGRVVLLFRMEPQVVKLWMLDDGSVDKKLENCQGNESNWCAETIELPFKCDSGLGAFGVAGNTETMIVFKCHESKKIAGYDEDWVSLYWYDCRKKSCKKIEIDGESSFPLHSLRSQITSFTESLHFF